MLTDSYYRLEQGSIMLSGKCSGIKGVACEAISKLNGGDVEVTFVSIDDIVKKLIKEKLNVDYVDNDEGYIINVDDSITVYANSERAKIYAAYSIKDKYKGKIKKGLYYSYPAVSHRSVRLYMPEKKNMPYFKKFIDMLVHLGYNTILLEIGGVMEYKRHPEINETWVEYCHSMKEYNEKPYVAEMSGYYRTKNSVHTYNGGGDIYSQEEMKELAAYCAERCIEIIPEVPSLSHSEYFLISHPELRECMDEPYACTACPSNEDLYSLVFDLYDEVIEVFQPKTLHIGHDEWWVMCVCDRCKGKDAATLFAQNVQKCYDYLKKKGIRTMMWADKLVALNEKTGEVQAGGEKHIYSTKTDATIEVMGEKHPLYEIHWFNPSEEVVKKGYHQVIHDTSACMQMLPKDIICINWYWATEPRIIDDYLVNNRTVVYGNCCMAGMMNCKERFEAGIKGISVSNWLDSSEAGMQRWNTLFDLGYGSIICWKHTRQEWDHAKNLEDTFAELYWLRNESTLNGSYVEVLHTASKTWEVGERYYADLPYAEEEKMTLGSYIVRYEDGSIDKFPVVYSLNIGTKSAITERWASARNWEYQVDKHLTSVASVCDFEKKEDGIWYRAVFPTKGNVVSCDYVPNAGLEEYVNVAETRIVN